MDITNEEFVETYLGAVVQPNKNVASYIPLAAEPATNGEVDWRTKGVLGAVKNQASCGSCWAFSATGSLEPALALAGQGMNNLSEQELVDCSSAYGNAGCNGGWMDSAFDYVLDHGLSATSDYKYVGRD
jgi:cathepsin L